jgi:hypothetical protein
MVLVYLYILDIMANNRYKLVEILRNTAQKLEKSNAYQWGHMGLCNCGFLAQEITRLSKDDIHKKAMLGHGDWSEQLNDYCPTSGLPMDDLISELVGFGFTIEELRHLERLSDPWVLQALGIENRHLKHNRKQDVVLYMNTWADRLEELEIDAVNLKELVSIEKKASSLMYF